MRIRTAMTKKCQQLVSPRKFLISADAPILSPFLWWPRSRLSYWIQVEYTDGQNSFKWWCMQNACLESWNARVLYFIVDLFCPPQQKRQAQLQILYFSPKHTALSQGNPMTTGLYFFILSSLRCMPELIQTNKGWIFFGFLVKQHFLEKKIENVLNEDKATLLWTPVLHSFSSFPFAGVDF